MRVPDGWKLSTIGSMADTVMGYAFKSNDFVDHGIPLIRMGNLYQNQLQLDRSPVFLPEHFVSEYQRFIINHGDLVMSMTGTMGKRDYGFTVQIPAEAPVCLLNQRVMKILPKKLTSREYLLNLLRSEHILSKLYSFPGGTKQANLSSQQVLELPTLIPPFSEQQKIAQILSIWDKAIEKLEALIAAKQKRKKALMQQLLTGKKRFAGYENEWKEVELNKLFKEVKDKVGVEKVIPHSITAGIGFVSHEEKWGKDISGSQYENYTLLRKGQFSYNKGNSKKYACGCIYLLKHSEEIAVPNVFISFERRNETICNEFYEQYFIADYCARELRKHITSGARSDGLLNLNKADFFSIKVPLPNFQEQRKIASVLTAADTEIQIHQKQLAGLKEQKKGMMQQLLTGKLRVIIKTEN